MTRSVSRRYVDPLDLIWTATAARVGFRIERSDTVYASKDEGRVLTIGSAETLDADDCLAQMIFHELCHALVQGPVQSERPDWGLCNRTDRDVGREHACLRVQAILAARVGLRAALAPTTEYRSFYDALPEDPLDGATDAEQAEVSVALARARAAPFAPHLDVALDRTAIVFREASAYADEAPDSLFAVVGATA